MRAHLVQFDIAWEDRAANFRTVEGMVSEAGVEPGDLVLLPELFDVGFTLNLKAAADPDGRTARFLSKLARQTGAVVQGGLAQLTMGAERATNRMLAVDSQGHELCDYAKVHPFSFGRETERYRGGDRVEVFEWRGARVMPAVCYDLRFPELFRRGVVGQGAEVIALGANWPEARQHHWRALAVARAIENLAIGLFVNRTGPDPHLNYVGGSIAVSHMGEVLGELGDEEAVLSVELDVEAVRAWRAKFPALKDAKMIVADG